MKYLICCLILWFPVNIYCQHISTVSAYGGYSFFKFWTNDDIKLITDYATSYSTGLCYQHSISRQVSAETGFQYSNNDLLRNDSRMKFNYVDLPVKFRFYTGKRKRFYISTGASVGFIMNALVDTYSKSGELDSYSIYDTFKKVNFGFSGALGARLPLNNRIQLNFEVIENLGIPIVSKVYDIPGLLNFKLRTTNLSFLVGVSYQLASKKRECISIP